MQMDVDLLIFKLISSIDNLIVPCEIAHRGMPQDLTDY